MNKLVFSLLFVCALALATAKSTGDHHEHHEHHDHHDHHEHDDKKKDKESSSEEIKEIKEIAETIKDRYNNTLLLDIVEKIEKLHEKCSDIEDKLDVAFEKVVDCFDDIELGSETFCSLIKNNYVRCTKPLKDLAESCLPEESKGLVSLGEKTVVAVIEQVCKSTVEEILELFNPCYTNKELDEIPECKEVNDTIEQHMDKLPSKDLVCSTVPKIRNCAKAHREASCQNPITKAAATKFHDAVDKAIKQECDALNTA